VRAKETDTRLKQQRQPRRRRPRPLLIAALLGGCLAVGVDAGVAGAASSSFGTITQLSTATATHTQTDPGISGNHVDWADIETQPGGSFNQDIFGYDLTTGMARNLSNTPTEQEHLPDIDGNNVVWSHFASGAAGDVVLYDLATNTPTTIASSQNSPVHFEKPAIGGRYVIFVRVSGTERQIAGYDNLTGFSLPPVTTNPAAHANPRVSGDYIVYEDYSSGTAAIYGYRVSTQGPPFLIAGGPEPQVDPDIDGNTVVWTGTVGGVQQVFAYDLILKTTTQLTHAVSHKLLPRVSGSLVVWMDDRSGNYDIYGYNLATHTEEALVTGPGDQRVPDPDGNRVVYASNETGNEQIYMLTLGLPLLGHPTATSVTCSPNPVAVASQTTCTATVSDQSTGTKTTPMGTVSFTHTNTGAFTPAPSCVLKATAVTGVARCSVTYTPLMTGAHEITASYGGDLSHGMSNGSTTVNATAAVCTSGDNDDNNGGGDDDENDGRSGAKSSLALSGFSELLVKSVKSDECDNDQNDGDSDNDRRGSDGD
jgi:TolB protein